MTPFPCWPTPDAYGGINYYNEADDDDESYEESEGEEEEDEDVNELKNELADLMKDQQQPVKGKK